MEDDEAQVGIIECVSLKNFMCHTNCKIEFDPNVNIVIGCNGSGKSSILSAIQVGLGGKATSSGRPVPLRNVIQIGKQFTEVTIVLRNRGQDAYKPDIFGSKITVKRRITCDGISSYKMKNEDGKAVSSKIEDLKAVLCAFNIRVNNPFAILTQDLSKTFLRGRDPKQKYNIFLQATQLENLEKLYKKYEERVTEVKFLLELNKQDLLVLEQNLKDEELQKNDIEKFDLLKKDCEFLQKERMWALVEELEEAMFQLETKQDSCRRNFEMAENKLKEIKHQYDIATQEKFEQTEKVHERHREMEQLDLQLQRLNTHKKELQSNIREMKAKHSSCGRDIEVKERESKNIKSRKADLEKHSAENLVKVKKEIEKKIEESRKKIECETEQANKLEEIIQSAHTENQQKQQELLTKNDELSTLDYQIRDAEKFLWKLQQCKANSILAFGKRIPSLLDLIEKEYIQGNFQEKPIGPLGLYIKVKDKKWALALECCFKPKLLQTFLCDNMGDTFQLQALMTDVYGTSAATPQIVTSKFISNVYDVSSRRVHSNEYPCVLDMIEVSVPMVLNSLIDERGIENILLVQHAPVARELMLKNPPAKCTEVFTAKGNSVFPYPTYRYYSSRKRNATMLAVAGNLDESIRDKQSELDNLQLSYSQKETEKNTLICDISHLEEKISKLQDTNFKSYSNIRKERAEIQELESTEFPDELSSLNAEEEEVQAELEILLKTQENLDEELRLQTLRLKGCDEEIKFIGRKLLEKKDEINKAEKKLFTLSSRDLHRLIHRKDGWTKEYEKLQAELQEAENAIEAKGPLLRATLESAEKACPRISDVRNRLEVEAALHEVEEHMKEIEQGLNISVRTEKCKHMRKEQESKMHDIDELKSLEKKLNEMACLRRESFELLRTTVCASIKYLFTSHLHQRGYYGKLQIDHKKRTFNITPRANQHSMGSNTKALSGGERSFLTVVLLIALWDAVELPFQIMDEYDVFMDQVNRKKSMDLMLSAALERNVKQFIFFSPQLLTAMKQSNKVRVIQIPSPER